MMFGLLSSSKNKAEKRWTKEDILIEKQRINIVIKSRLANGILGAFLLSLVFTLIIIILKGFKIIEVSDTVIYTLLGYTIAYIPAMLYTIVKFVFITK